MADLEILYDRDDSLLTRNTSSSIYGRASISGAALGTKEWLGVAVAALGGGSVSDGQIIHITTPDEDDVQVARHEASSTANDELVQMGVMRRFTGDSSTPFQIGLSRAGGGTADAYMRDSAVLAIDLDGLVENSDYWWDEDATAATHTSSMVDRSSITITPAANSKVLVIATAEVNIDSTAVNYEMSIREGTTEQATVSYEGENTVEFRSHVLMWVDEDTGSATERTYALSTRDDTNNLNEYVKSSIFVIDLGLFKDVSSSVVASHNPTTQDFETAASFTHTPTVTGDQVVLGFMVSNPNTNSLERSRLTFDGTLDVPDATNLGGSLWDNDDEAGILLMSVKSVADTGDVIDLDVMTDSASYFQFEDISLVAFSVQLAPDPAYEQEGYRWRDDDGDEADATWLEAQDTDITALSEATTRLRVLIDSADDPGTVGFKLQYRVADSSDEWVDV